jgi:hypothetical protein
MQADLSQSQWDFASHGTLVAPDGTAYTRRGSRMKRRKVDEAIEQGAPVVVHWYGGGQLDWFDDDEARQQWQKCRPAFTAEEPKLGGDVVWTGGLWLSDNESPLVVLEGHC